MRPYPVEVPRESYRGRDPRRLAKVSEHNRIAERVETYLNADLEKQPDNVTKVYLSHTIASDLGEAYEDVQRVVFGIDCGHNGVTLFKGNGGMS